MVTIKKLMDLGIDVEAIAVDAETVLARASKLASDLASVSASPGIVADSQELVGGVQQLATDLAKILVALKG